MKYMTVYQYGASNTICSEHKTFHAAEKAALKCEKRGGGKHKIWEVRIYNINRRIK